MTPAAPDGHAMDPDLGETLLRPVRSHHAFESCVEQLATAIRLGGYPRGSALPTERILAERLGVSRATLREAIAALRMAGFVETHRGRGGGTVVVHRPLKPGEGSLSFSREELLDALEFRRIVEPGAAYLAAKAADPDARRRSQLKEMLTLVDEAADPAGHRQADARLHLEIAKLAGSRMLLDAVTEVQKRLHDMLIAIPVLATNIEHSHHQHHAVVSAVLSGHPDGARQAMEEHCDDTAALLRGLL
ncbi:FadR/GntR family transcriptional regulator [Streptomyces sp. NPDC002405]|uniref:FadR/GntR family transcriptional regulator n=1 Tax=unclassified Streptomyces TaxID=2593676 RepID=UPI003699CC8A